MVRPKHYPSSILLKVLHKTFGGIPKKRHQLFGAVFVPWNGFIRVWIPIDGRRQRCIYICVRYVRWSVLPKMLTAFNSSLFSQKVSS